MLGKLSTPWRILSVRKFVLYVAIALMSMSQAAVAKCATSRLVAFDVESAETITIDVPGVADKFHVWNGPGVRMNGAAVHMNPARQPGYFVDWPRGEVSAAPEDTRLYRVTFYCGPAESGEYTAIYEIDYAVVPGSDGGFIFLPGPGDARYRSNTSTILHGVEGSWYRSTSSWEERVRPLLPAGA